MKLTLTTDDGELIEWWDVVAEFGEVEKHPASMALMGSTIAGTIERYKRREFDARLGRMAKVVWAREAREREELLKEQQKEEQGTD